MKRSSYSLFLVKLYEHYMFASINNNHNIQSNSSDAYNSNSQVRDFSNNLFDSNNNGMRRNIETVQITNNNENCKN